MGIINQCIILRIGTEILQHPFTVNAINRLFSTIDLAAAYDSKKMSTPIAYH